MFYPSLMQSYWPRLCPRPWLSTVCVSAYSAGEQREINHSSSYSQPNAWHLCSGRDQPRPHGRNMERIQAHCRGKGTGPGAEAELDTPAGLPRHHSHPALSAGVSSPPYTAWGRPFQGISLFCPSGPRREPPPAGAISFCHLK